VKKGQEAELSYRNEIGATRDLLQYSQSYADFKPFVRLQLLIVLGQPLQAEQAWVVLLPVDGNWLLFMLDLGRNTYLALLFDKSTEVTTWFFPMSLERAGACGLHRCSARSSHVDVSFCCRK
jgi:hypothetical protein